LCPEGAAGDEPLRGSGRRPPLPAEKGVYAVCFRLEGPVEIRDRRGRVLAKAGAATSYTWAALGGLEVSGPGCQGT